MLMDSRGMAREALLTFAGPTQINFVTPAAAAAGGALLRIQRGDEIAQTATLSIVRAEPGLFSADSSGTGLAAAVVTTVNPDGSLTTRLVSGGPIDVTAGPVVLSLYGTGWRAGENIEASIGGLPGTILFSGAQGQYPGLDQMNLLVPSSLAGRGEVGVSVTANGRTANQLRMAIR